MQGKEHFLDRLNVRIEAAERRLQTHPKDLQAEMYAKALRLVYEDFSCKPAHHPLFRRWAREFTDRDDNSSGPRVPAAQSR